MAHTIFYVHDVHRCSIITLRASSLSCVLSRFLSTCQWVYWPTLRLFGWLLASGLASKGDWRCLAVACGWEVVVVMMRRMQRLRWQICRKLEIVRVTNTMALTIVALDLLIFEEAGVSPFDNTLLLSEGWINLGHFQRAIGGATDATHEAVFWQTNRLDEQRKSLVRRGSKVRYLKLWLLFPASFSLII